MAWALGPEKCENELGLAFALLFAGQYAEGLARFESRFQYKLRSYDSWPYPKWNGSRVDTLMVVSEMGLGDALSMARFIPPAAARVGHLIYAVQPELVRLLAKVLTGVEVVPYPKTFPRADAWISVGSLPVALGMTDAEIRDAPGLPVPRMRAPDGWALPGRRFRIGICWAGSTANDIDKWRSLPGPEPFLALYQVPGVELYGFQFGDPAQQAHTSGAVSLIRDLTPWVRDCCDSAAILAQMDLVVTVETFLGHLAGFMDVPTWVLYSRNGLDWRMRDEGEAPLWYARHRIFRQGPEAAWGLVWQRVVAALGETVETWNHERLPAAAD
jgi:hypothetical protein